MGSLFFALLIILGVTFVIYSIHYFLTLPERRENEERLRRSFLLYEEKIEAERARQNARIAGAIAIENINKIAGLK